jgi:maltoporin
MKLNIKSTPEEVKAISADVINIGSHNGYVVMNFLQTVGNTIANEENNAIIQDAVVMARVMLSWEHFVDTTQQMMYFMKQSQKNAESNYSKAVTFANNFETDEGNSSDS